VISKILDFLWILQRLYQRKIGFINVKEVNVASRELDNNYIRILRFLNTKKNFINYKEKLNSTNKVIELNNPILNTKTGVIWMDSGILEESTIWPVSRLLKWEPRPLFYSKIKQSSINLPDNGYYHFLIEDLPRFIETIEENVVKQVLIGSESNYVKDSLGIMGLDNYVVVKHPVRCERLIISEKNLGGIFSKFERNILLNFAKSINCIENFDVIFIDRLNKSKEYNKRGLKYASEIKTKLKNFRVKTVYMEQLNLSEQISIIKSARIVIGFHGAGLANMVWNDNSLRIIELTEYRMTSHFGHIASICGHEYLRFKCSDFIKFDENHISKILRII
jgi:hypothetical protein